MHRHFDGVWVDKIGSVSPKNAETTMQNVMKAVKAAKVTSVPVVDKSTPPLEAIQVGRVAEGERYLYIDSMGEVCHTSDMGGLVSDKHYRFGNYFHTEPEAEQAADEWLLQLKYRQWRKQHDPTVKLDIDWFANRFREITYKKDIAGNNGVINLFSLLFSDTAKAVRFYNEHKELIHKVLGENKQNLL